MTTGQPVGAAHKGIVKRNLVLGVLFVTLMGGPLHVALEWTGRNPVAAALLPVNESVWEHLKLVFLPVVIWYSGSLLLWRKRRTAFDSGRWLLAGAASLLAALLFIVVFYYTYTGALGIHSLLADVLSLPIGVALGQTLAWHVLRHATARPWHRAAALGVFLLLLAAFAAFTYRPPAIPLFRDAPSGTYGFR